MFDKAKDSEMIQNKIVTWEICTNEIYYKITNKQIYIYNEMILITNKFSNLNRFSIQNTKYWKWLNKLIFIVKRLLMQNLSNNL